MKLKKKISQIISIIYSYHKSLKNKYWIGELEGNHNSSAALRLDMADQRTYLNVSLEIPSKLFQELFLCTDGIAFA